MSDPITKRLGFRCDNRWDLMSPRGEGRHCAECDTTVVDLSRLTRREALRRTKEGACVRLRFGPEGAPIFRVEPSRRGGLVVAAAMLGGCAGGAGASGGVAEVRVESAPALEPVAMTPLPEGVALSEVADHAALEGEVSAWRHEGGPTPEQIALTEAKHRRLVAPIAWASQSPHPYPHPPPPRTPNPSHGVQLQWLGVLQAED